MERFNRNLKEKMYRYFTAKNTRKYVDVLPDLLYAYNQSYNQSIGMAPPDVTPTMRMQFGLDCIRLKRNSETGIKKSVTMYA